MNWISIRDELPPENKYVLVNGEFFAKYSKDKNKYGTHWEFYDGCCFGCGQGRDYDSTVTHWFMIPELPQ